MGKNGTKLWVLYIKSCFFSASTSPLGHFQEYHPGVTPRTKMPPKPTDTQDPCPGLALAITSATIQHGPGTQMPSMTKTSRRNLANSGLTAGHHVPHTCECKVSSSLHIGISACAACVLKRSSLDDSKPSPNDDPSPGNHWSGAWQPLIPLLQSILGNRNEQ